MRIIHLIQQYRNSSFIKNMSIVMSGTAVAQIIGFAMTPVISRLFNPADFGVLGSFNSVLSVVAAGVTLQYSQAIMLPKNDDDSANVFAVSVLSVLLISIISCCIIYTISEWLIELLNISEFKWLLWFLPVSIFINGINQSFQAWCVRRKAFKQTASSQMIRAGSVNVLQVISGLLKTGSCGLVVSSIAADGLASLNLTQKALGSDGVFLKNSLSWEKIRISIIKYRDFPIYSATENAMNSLSQGLPVLLLAHFYGIGVAGAYAFGIRLLLVPMSFVLTALRQVLFQKVSESYNNGGMLLSLFVKATVGLFLLSFFPALLLFLWAPDIFSLLFGLEWYTAGIYAKWLIFWLVPMFCNVPSILIARILRQQKKLFFTEILVLVFRVLILMIGGYFFCAKNTVILFSLAGAIINMSYIIWIAVLLLKKEKTYFYKELAA